MTAIIESLELPKDSTGVDLSDELIGHARTNYSAKNVDFVTGD